MRTLRWVAVAACIAAAAAPAAAQGRGNAYGHAKHGTTPPASAQLQEQQPTIAGTGVRTFGSWLDDASMLPDGTGSLAISFGYWKTEAFREWDVPVTDASIGIAPRVSFGVSLPFYHASPPGAPVTRGLGDLYLSGKVQLHKPGSGRAPGLSVTPVLQVLSGTPVDGSGRVSWGLPINVEVQQRGWRVFGSAGYFSRGSLFASGAIEVGVTERTYVTGTLTQSHSTRKDDLSAALGLAQTRTDVTGAVSHQLTDTLMVFGGIGRTISKRDQNSAELTLNGGIAFAFRVRSLTK